MTRSILARRRHTSVRARRGAAARRGFTLVSVLVAMVLLAIGVMALGKASTESVKFQTIAQNKTSAIAIGRAYLENVRTRDPWTVATESGVKVDNDGVTSASGKFTRSMEMTVVRSNLIKLDITVVYPRQTGPVILTTYMFRGNGLSNMAGSDHDYQHNFTRCGAQQSSHAYVQA